MDNERIDVEFHPIGAPIGIHHQRYFVGAIVWNTITVVLVLLLLYLSAITQAQSSDDGGICPPNSQHQGLFRFPSFAFVPYQFLVQGSCLAAAHCAFFPARGSSGAQTLGVITLSVHASIPFIIWWRVLRDANFHAGALRDVWFAEHCAGWTPWRCRIYEFFYGCLVWTSTHGHFVERFGMIFEGYSPGLTFWILPEVGHLIIMSLFASWRPGDRVTCSVRNFMVAGVLLLYTAALLVVRPYMSKAVLVLQSAISLLTALAVLGIATGIAVGAAAPMTIGVAFLLIAAMFQFFGLACDVGAYMFDLCVGRRKKAWAQRDVDAAFQITDDADCGIWLDGATTSAGASTGSRESQERRTSLELQPIHSHLLSTNLEREATTGSLGRGRARRTRTASAMVQERDRIVGPSPPASAATRRLSGSVLEQPLLLSISVPASDRGGDCTTPTPSADETDHGYSRRSQGPSPPPGTTPLTAPLKRRPTIGRGTPASRQLSTRRQSTTPSPARRLSVSGVGRARKQVRRQTVAGSSAPPTRVVRSPAGTPTTSTLAGHLEDFDHI
eukprot:TRINITY_DN1262_c0_g1_i1.p2 TRINITY_DN1262_c0_g1~~TRINITY_DN1262_c0_g1_i1.p2  ORF type:complete len:556 (+),score=121.50 TRINITY_DN1262_c0_g1_i1:2057-3724(+)